MVGVAIDLCAGSRVDGTGKSRHFSCRVKCADSFEHISSKEEEVCLAWKHHACCGDDRYLAYCGSYGAFFCSSSVGDLRKLQCSCPYGSSSRCCWFGNNFGWCLVGWHVGFRRIWRNSILCTKEKIDVDNLNTLDNRAGTRYCILSFASHIELVKH
jgi:hypothetical protein